MQKYILAALKFTVMAAKLVWLGTAVAVVYYLAAALFSGGVWEDFYGMLLLCAFAILPVKMFELFLKKATFEAKRTKPDWTAVTIYMLAKAKRSPNGMDIADEEDLPYTKTHIKWAIVSLLGNFWNYKLKRQLFELYLSLAYWQPIRESSYTDIDGIATALGDVSDDLVAANRLIETVRVNNLEIQKKAMAELDELKEELKERGFAI